MIELNNKTQQDFLNREWVQRLLDAGVDMSDAKYYIGIYRDSEKMFEAVYYKDELNFKEIESYEKEHPDYKIDRMPTYTVSELLYKLHEWIYPTIDGVEYAGGISFIKDAPFYIFYYDLKTRDYDPKLAKGNRIDNYIHATFEYPIESLAGMLIQCHKKTYRIRNA